MREKYQIIYRESFVFEICSTEKNRGEGVEKKTKMYISVHEIMTNRRVEFDPLLSLVVAFVFEQRPVCSVRVETSASRALDAIRSLAKPLFRRRSRLAHTIAGGRGRLFERPSARLE